MNLAWNRWYLAGQDQVARLMAWRDAGIDGIIADMAAPGQMKASAAVLGRTCVGVLVSDRWPALETALTSGAASNADRRAMMLEADFVVLNSEQKGADILERNRKLKDRLIRAIPGLAAKVFVTDPMFQFAHIERGYGDGTLTGAGTWLYAAPAPYEPEWIFADAALARATGRLLVYLGCQAAQEYSLKPMGIQDLLAQAEYAALEMPQHIAYWGLYQQERPSDIEGALLTASARAGSLGGMWMLRQPRAAVVLPRGWSGWGVDKNNWILVYQLIAACFRNGLAVDVLWDDQVKSKTIYAYGAFLFPWPNLTAGYNLAMDALVAKAVVIGHCPNSAAQEVWLNPKLPQIRANMMGASAAAPRTLTEAQSWADAAALVVKQRIRHNNTFDLTRPWVLSGRSVVREYVNAAGVRQSVGIGNGEIL